MNSTAFFSALLAAFGWGGGTICDKVAVRFISARGMVVLRGLIAAVLLSTWGIVAGLFEDIARGGRAALIWVVLGSLLSQVFGQFMYYRALKVAPASQVVPVTATYPLITVALAMLLLGERLTAAKFLGVLLIVVGIMLVSGLVSNQA